YLYARKSRSRIIESCTGTDRLIKNRSQCADAVVDYAWRVFLPKSHEPILAITFADFANIRFEQRWPRATDEIDCLLAVIFRARLERHVSLDLLEIYLYRVANDHLATGDR